MKRTIILTGATRGIGKAIAKRLCKESNLQFVLIYRSDDATAALLSQELADRASDIMFRKCDITDKHEVRETLRAAIDKYKSLDVLINNAGITEDAGFVTMPLVTMKRVVHTNLIGSMVVSFEALPFLLKGTDPSIINISSLAAVNGKEGQSAYSLSKGGLIGFTKWLVVRYSPKGLVVNTVAPGFIGTDMVKDLPPKTYNHILEGTPLKRIGDADEVAELVAFLANTSCRYLNSNTIRTDGGFHR